MTKTTSEATEKGSLIYPQSKGTGRAVFGVGICCCVTFFWVIVMIVGFLMIVSVADEAVSVADEDMKEAVEACESVANADMKEAVEAMKPKFIPLCGT